MLELQKLYYVGGWPTRVPRWRLLLCAKELQAEGVELFHGPWATTRCGETGHLRRAGSFTRYQMGSKQRACARRHEDGYEVVRVVVPWSCRSRTARKKETGAGAERAAAAREQRSI
jgi:hypothetical protein